MSTFLFALVVAGSAVAQAPAAPDPLLSAITLPQQADSLRQRGVPDADVRQALTAAREKKLSAGEAADTIRGAGDAVNAHGVPAGFGEFVKSQLESGKRGPELVAAIQAECAAKGVPVPQRGTGPAPGTGNPHGGAAPHGAPPPGAHGEHGGAPPAGGAQGAPAGAPEGAPKTSGKPPGAPEGAHDKAHDGTGKAPPKKDK